MIAQQSLLLLSAYIPSTGLSRTLIVVAAAVLVLQTLLSALLLAERRRHIRERLAVSEQLNYENMIAELTTDAVRHTYNAPRALDDAVRRVGLYADARTVVFVRQTTDREGSEKRVEWRAPQSLDEPGGAKLEIPLLINGKSMGSLQLYRDAGDGGWPTPLAGRMVAAAEIIAGAVSRAEAAREIRSGEELNRAVLASLTMQIAILDREGTIIRVNENWRDLSQRALKQYDHDGFVGANYLSECERAAARDCEEALDVKRGIESVLARRTQRFMFEYHCLPEDRWYLLTVDRLEHDDGGAVISHFDVTDRRLAEREAEETRRQIAHMGRVVLIGEMAAAVSHELSQPLAAIRANAVAGMRLLAGGGAPPSETREILADIDAAGQRAAEVVENIRMLLRNEPPKLVTVDLNDICRRAVRMIRRDAALRGARLELALDAQQPLTLGDQVQLQQVLLNLALNAIDATMAAKREREVCIGTGVMDDEVEIFVSDTGQGLPADVQAHLFESFFSTKPNGLGLGLVIVRSIVERHRGRVRAENVEEGGAVFRVLLPRVVQLS